METTFITRDKETGTIIDNFNTYEEALLAIEKYEAQDVLDGNYSENFYEIAIITSASI